MHVGLGIVADRRALAVGHRIAQVLLQELGIAQELLEVIADLGEPRWDAFRLDGGSRVGEELVQGIRGSGLGGHGVSPFGPNSLTPSLTLDDIRSGPSGGRGLVAYWAAMKVFVFDLLPYAEHLDHLKDGKELPWPLPRRHFKPEVAARTYAEHLDAWEAMDRLGYDGVGFNEHHTSPYGLMNSPNLLAAAAAQRTQRLKLLVYGNLLPLHDPLRLAEELAMLDCMSNGRIVSGFARGIPREHYVYNVSLADSRARFEEAWEIIRRAWTEEVFSYEGRFWSYRDVA